MKFFIFFLLLIPAVASADVDADLMSAREAFRLGNSAKLAVAAAKLKQTPFEPYATYYQLRMGWEDKDSKPIKAFLAREEDTPIIDQHNGHDR